MANAMLAWYLIIGAGPDGLADRCMSIFLKTLAQKLRAGGSPFDKRDRSTGPPDRGDADRILHLGGGLEAFPLGAEGGQ